MPRPDMTALRTEQILDAFERCVARFGLEGSSLEKIGEEAGMKRTILRHYIGNRDDLVRALCERMVGRWEAGLRELEAAPAGDDPREQLLAQLFDDLGGKSGEAILVAESLIAAAEQFPFVVDAMRGYLDDLTRVLAKRLALVAPKATPVLRWKVAYGLTSILFNDSSLVVLDLPAKYRRAARECAGMLVDRLSS